MAPPQQSKPAVKPGATFHSKPRKGEVKVSVINICCPYSLDILRPNPQTNSCVLTQRPQVPVSHVRRNQAVSKEPHTATTTLQTGSCLNSDGICRTGSSTHHPIGHSPQLRPRYPAGVSDSALKECLIIRPLHNQIQKTPDGPAAL